MRGALNTDFKVPGAGNLEPFNIGFHQDQHFVSLAKVNKTTTEKILLKEPTILESLQPDDEVTRCAECGNQLEDGCLPEHDEQSQEHFEIFRDNKNSRG